MQSLLVFMMLGLVAFQVAVASPTTTAELIRKLTDLFISNPGNGQTSPGTSPPENPLAGVSPLSIVGKPTSQSTTHGRFSSDRAVDGSDSTTLSPNGFCSHTSLNKANPWWKVDLGDLFCIAKVTILNRGDCCSDRLENAVVRAGTSWTPTDNEACGSPVTADQAAPQGGTIEQMCSKPLLARYVSVDIPGTATLQLCEVTVDVFPMKKCLTRWID